MFENVLLESARRSGRGRRAMTLPVSIAAHALVLGVFLGSSLWSVEDVSDPPIPLTFHTPAPPPAPPALRSTATQKTEPVHPTLPMTLPTVIPERASVVSNAPGPEDPTDPVSVEGGDLQGRPDGIPGGTGDTPGGTEIHAGSERPRQPWDPGVKAPELVLRFEPIYPDAARKARMEGVVILEAIVTSTGSVEDIRVLKSATPLLDDAARRALLRWRYRPATLNGRAVPVYLTVTVKFILH